MAFLPEDVHQRDGPPAPFGIGHHFLLEVLPIVHRPHADFAPTSSVNPPTCSVDSATCSVWSPTCSLVQSTLQRDAKHVEASVVTCFSRSRPRGPRRCRESGGFV